VTSSTRATAQAANLDLDTAVEAAEAQYVQANPGSRQLALQASAPMPGGNTRTTLHFSPFPLYMAGGNGGRLTDVDGHEYLDFVNEYTAGLFGHSDAVVRETLAEIIAEGMTLGAPNRYEPLLAAEVAARFASIEQVRFCNSGTEANLFALASARAVTTRPAVMVFAGGYHGGLTYFAHGASPLNVPHEWVVSTYNDAEGAVADIERNAARLAAVLVEPMQGAGGCIAGDPAFLAALRDACTRHGIILIFDEVMTSRLGYGGLQGELGITPDMTTLGKYIGGGITIGAFGGRADIMGRFDPSRPGAFPHGGTFNNNVLAMAAGYAALTRVLTAQALDATNRLGDRIREGINERAARHGLPVLSTGVGSILGVHFHRGPARNEADFDAFASERERGLQQLRTLFHFDMIAAGIYISRRIMGNLSLATTEADAERLLEAVEEFMVARQRLIEEVLS
jgi:glutamate-1-semialdehyde 2,1-aminomutase